MLSKDDREFEELLRSLPTAQPPEGARNRILAGAGALIALLPRFICEMRAFCVC